MSMMYLISFGYALLLLGIWLSERRRTAVSGPDLLSLLLVLFSVQLIIPGVFITGVIAACGGAPAMDNTLFDKVYSKLSLLEPSITLVFSAEWVVSLYAGWLVAHEMMKNRPGQESGELKTLSCSPWRWTLVMLVGLACMWKLLTLLGDSLFESYQNLILFRAVSDEVERTLLKANLFSSAQTFAFISIVGLFIPGKYRYRALKMLFVLCCMIIFGLMCASRRNLLLDVILIYFVFVLMKKRWYFFRCILPISVLSFPVIAFGKNFLARIAIADPANINLSDVIDPNYIPALLRGMSDIGLSLVESWATLLYLDIPFRFGVDHLMSIAQRIPVGFMFGWDKSWLPERIVRISTERFAGPFELDIPPGLIGQMWLDFGYLGPIIWGLVFGLQIGFAQWLFQRYARTYEVAVLFVLGLFVIALPLNTGSFDFTFSVDIFLLFVLLAFIYWKPVRVSNA